MTVIALRSFDRDRRARLAWAAARLSPTDAARLDLAVDDAIAALAATLPGFETGYPPSAESDALPGGPYRDKLFGTGRAKKYRIVFRIASGTIELVALRHASQPDLTAADL